MLEESTATPPVQKAGPVMELLMVGVAGGTFTFTVLLFDEKILQPELLEVCTLYVPAEFA
jgi:hypothetical protein